MAELKTKINDVSIHDFINNIPDENKRTDCNTLLDLMIRITGEQPKMWGDSIVGFGQYHYKYESGREGDWFITGFSPRKSNLTLYLMDGFTGYEELLQKLGKHKTGKSCLYLKTLKDVNIDVLSDMIAASAAGIKEKYK
jgi:hypothetical protein